MPSYRIYVLDSTDHIREPPAIVECEDDQAAIDEAKQLLDGKALEVWDRERLVAQLAPVHPQRK